MAGKDSETPMAMAMVEASMGPVSHASLFIKGSIATPHSDRILAIYNYITDSTTTNEFRNAQPRTQRSLLRFFVFSSSSRF